MASDKGSHGGELKAHEKSYLGFLSMLKVGTIASVLLTLIVIFLIAN